MALTQLHIQGAEKDVERAKRYQKIEEARKHVQKFLESLNNHMVSNKYIKEFISLLLINLSLIESSIKEANNE